MAVCFLFMPKQLNQLHKIWDDSNFLPQKGHMVPTFIYPLRGEKEGGILYRNSMISQDKDMKFGIQIV